MEDSPISSNQKMSILGLFGGDKMCFKKQLKMLLKMQVCKTIVCRKLNILVKLTWQFKTMDCKTFRPHQFTFHFNR